MRSGKFGGQWFFPNENIIVSFVDPVFVYIEMLEQFWYSLFFFGHSRVNSRIGSTKDAILSLFLKASLESLRCSKKNKLCRNTLSYGRNKNSRPLRELSFLMVLNVCWFFILSKGKLRIERRDLFWIIWSYFCWILQGLAIWRRSNQGLILLKHDTHRSFFFIYILHIYTNSFSFYFFFCILRTTKDW